MKGPFRIESPARIRTQALTSTEPIKDYMGRLIRLIPSEVIGVYLTIRGIFATNEPVSSNGDDIGFLSIWPAICIFLVIAVRAWGTTDQNGSLKSIQWGSVFISVISFVIWVLAIGDDILGLKPEDQRIASALVVLWTFITGYFYRGSNHGQGRGN